jgi:hypothetical protein
MLLSPAPDLVGERPLLEAGVVLESIDQELLLPLVQLQRRASTYLYLTRKAVHQCVQSSHNPSDGGYPSIKKERALLLNVLKCIFPQTILVTGNLRLAHLEGSTSWHVTDHQPRQIDDKRKHE